MTRELRSRKAASRVGGFKSLVLSRRGSVLGTSFLAALPSRITSSEWSLRLGRQMHERFVVYSILHPTAGSSHFTSPVEKLDISYANYFLTKVFSLKKHVSSWI